MYKKHVVLHGVIQVGMLVLILVFFRSSCNMHIDIEARATVRPLM